MSETQERESWAGPRCALIQVFIRPSRSDPGVEAAREQTELLLIIDLILLQMLNYEHTLHLGLGGHILLFFCAIRWI